MIVSFCMLGISLSWANISRSRVLNIERFYCTINNIKFIWMITIIANFKFIELTIKSSMSFFIYLKILAVIWYIILHQEIDECLFSLISYNLNKLRPHIFEYLLFKNTFLWDDKDESPIYGTISKNQQIISMIFTST